jgi:hypothetical protein
MAAAGKPGRVRVERGIYRWANGWYAVCARHARAALPHDRLAG